MNASSPSPKPLSLLGLLSASLYGLWTLLPDSSTLMVSWVWVLIWQVALICPVLWLVFQVASEGWKGLGKGLDFWAIGIVFAIVLSSFTSRLPQQSIWFGIAALSVLAALYACNHYVQDESNRQRVLTAQGLLQVAFIVLSLGLWGVQTGLPELDRLTTLQGETGIRLPFSFESIETRNWAPIGHQNYVAGYLTLAIPSLVGLSWSRTGRLRWIFAAGSGLGLVALYTTSSRGGWLGLLASIAILFVMLERPWQSLMKIFNRPEFKLSQWQKWGLIAGTIAVVIAGIGSTGRLNGVLDAISARYVPGELAYRMITNATGWAMGAQSPIWGMGLGTVPHLFQQFRPFWSGREAELVFQLHSTPMQLWAELGILGLGLWLGTIVWVGRLWWQARKQLPIMTHTLLAGLLGYTMQSLMDYQLDNLCIIGTIVIFMATIAAEFRETPTLQSEKPSQFPTITPKLSRGIAAAIVGVTLVAILWLIPVHRAWMISSQGFQAIKQVDDPKLTPEEKQAAIVQFTQNLEEANKLVPWEPYYPQQLGWILGDLGLRANRPDFLEQSIRWLNQARLTAPHQEFVYSNLGWLQLNTNPKAASEAFTQAARLVPAKRGVFYGLGRSLLFQKRFEPAIDALALEFLRDPIALTSPYWQTPGRKTLLQQVVKRTESLYSEIINQSNNVTLISYVQACRSTFRWWMGNFEGAMKDAEASQFQAMKAVLALQRNEPIDLNRLATQRDVSPSTIATLTAWLQPEQRATQLQKAWVLSTQQPMPPGQLENLQTSMTSAKSFDEWLKQKSPGRELRRQRLGFGVLSRHIDGVIPSDFLTIEENLAMTYLMKDLVYEWKYYPDLEKPIQQLREKILGEIS